MRTTLVILLVAVCSTTYAQPCSEVRPPVLFEMSIVGPNAPHVLPGDNFCLIFSTTNFIDVGGFSFTLSFDPEVLTALTENPFSPTLKSPSTFPGILSNNVGFSNATIEDGLIPTNWFNFDGTGTTLTDGTPLIQFCFEATGEIDACSLVYFDPNLTNPPPKPEVFFALPDGSSCASQEIYATFACDQSELCLGFLDNSLIGQNQYLDNDGDGFGSSDSTIVSCDLQIGYVTNNSDCDDNNPNINPDAIEVLNNGIDDDCAPSTLDAPTATHQINGTEISIYPNPVSHILYIDQKGLDLEVNLYSIEGRLIFTSQLNDNRLNLSNIPIGIYNLILVDRHNGQKTIDRLVKI